MGNTQQEVDILFKGIGDFSDVTGGIQKLQSGFNKLKLPANTKAQLNGLFDKTLKDYNKLSDFELKGITNNKELKQVESITKELELDFKKIGDSVKYIKVDNIDFSKIHIEEIDQAIAKVNELREKLETTKNTSLENINTEFAKIGDNYKKTGKDGNSKYKFTDAIKEFQQLTEAERGSEQEAKLLATALKSLKASNKDGNLSGLIGALETYKAGGQNQGLVKELEEAEKELKTVKEENEKAFSTEAQDNYSKSSAEMSNRVQKTGEDIKNAGKSTASFNSELDQIKSRIAYFFGLNNAVNLFQRAVRQAISTVQELDETMTAAAVVTEFSVGDMWDQLPEYTQRASELGDSINDAYEAATLYYQQGLDTNEVVGVSNETLKMARIAGLEAADATDAMTAALRGFNKEVTESNAQNVNDVYSNVAAKSASNVEELSTAMEKVASIASSANMEFETTTAFLAQIIETTREAPETAGTALKTIIARFTEVKELFSEGQLTGTDEEGEEISINKIDTALQSVGMSLKDFLNGNEGLDEIFMELASKWDTLDLATQRYIATQAAGSRQQSRFIAMMSDYARTQELVGYAYDSEGASQEQFEKTTESLETKINQLKNAWNTFLMGLSNNDIIKGAIDLLTKFIETVNTVIDKLSGNSGLVKSILSLTAAIGGLSIGRELIDKGTSILGGKIGEAIGTKEKSEDKDNSKSKKSSIFSKLFDFGKKEEKNNETKANTVKIEANEVEVDGENDTDTENIVDKISDGLSNQKDDTNKDYLKNITTDFGKELVDKIKNDDSKNPLEKMAAVREAYGEKLDEIRNNAISEGKERLELLKQEKVEKIKALGDEKRAALEGQDETKKAELEALYEEKITALRDAEDEKTKRLEGIIKANEEAVAGEEAEALKALSGESAEEYAAIAGEEAEAAAAVASEAAEGGASIFTTAGKKIKDTFSSLIDTVKGVISVLGTGGLVAGAAIAAIGALAFVTYRYATRMKRAIEKLDELNETYTDNKTESENYQEQLEQKYDEIEDLLSNYDIELTVNDDNVLTTLDELATNGELTLTDREQLKLLKEETVELKRQKKAQDKLTEASQKEAEEQAIEAAQIQNSQDYSGSTTRQTNLYIKGELTTITSTSTESDVFSAIEGNSKYLTQQEQELEELQAQRDNEIINGAKEDSKVIKQLDEDIEDKQKLIDSVSSTLDTEIEQAKSISTALAESETAEGQAYYRMAQDAIYEYTYRDASASEKLSAFFGSEGQKDLKKYFQEAYKGENKSKKSAKQLWKIAKDLGYELEDMGITYEDFNDYLEESVNLLDEADDSAEKFKGTLAGLNEALETDNQDSDWKIISDAYEDIEELYTNNMVGTDEYQQYVSLLTGISFDEGVSFEDRSKALAEAWPNAKKISDYYFNEDEGLGLYNAQQAILNSGLMDQNGQFAESFKTSADAAAAFSSALGGIPIGLEATEVLLKALEGQGWGFEEITFISDTFDEFASDYEMLESTLSSMDESASKNRAKQLLDELTTYYEEGEADLDTLVQKYGEDKIIEIKAKIEFELDQVELEETWQEAEKLVELKGTDTDYLGDAYLAGENAIDNLIANMDEEVKKVFLASEAYQDLSNAYTAYTEAVRTGDTEQIASAYDTLHDKQMEVYQGGILIRDIYSEVKQKIQAIAEEDFEGKEFDASKMIADLDEFLSYAANNDIEIDVSMSTKELFSAYEEFLNPKVEVDTSQADDALDDTIEKEEDASQTVTPKIILDEVSNKKTNGQLDTIIDKINEIEGNHNLKFNVSGSGNSSSKQVSNSFSNWLNGIFGYNGTAHANGTQPTGLQNSWKTKNGETALTGELGQEMVVHGDKWWTVGDKGPEFTNIPKGSIVFNHKQTRDLLSKGYTTNRGKALAHGTAYAGQVWSYKGSSGSSSSSSDDSNKWENTLDKLYNLVEDVEAALRKQEKLEREYNRLLENENATATEIITNLAKQRNALQEELDLNNQLLAGRKKQLQDIGNETWMDDDGNKYSYNSLGLGQYAWYDTSNGAVQIDWDKINAITDEDRGDQIEQYISRLEELADEINDTEEEIEDIQDQIDEQNDILRDEAIDFIDRVREALIQQQQDKIDEYQDLSDVINDSNTDILNSLQEQIDLERQIRDNTEKETDIAEKERKLAYLRRDTSGANALEIKQLEEELAEDREDYQDTLVDQMISNLEDENEKAQEQREKQIELMQAQLDWMEESGGFNEEVERLIESAFNGGELKTDSELYKLLYEVDNVAAQTELEQNKWNEEFSEQANQAMAGILANSGAIADMSAALQSNADANADKICASISQISFPTSSSSGSGSSGSGTSSATGGTTDKDTSSSGVKGYVYNYTTKAQVLAYDVSSGKSKTLSALGTASSSNAVTALTQAKAAAKTALLKLLGSRFDYSEKNIFYKDTSVTTTPVYKTGGLADFTGPAWLDGTKTKPEMVLNSRDTENFIQLKDILSDILTGATSVTSPTTTGDNYFDINIDVKEIANDYDVDQLISKVKKEIYNNASYRNVNAINHIR